MKIIVMITSSLLLTGVCQGQWIIAHRGASFDAPENTVAAFNEAWDQDADGIEGDYHLTSDNQIVCIHDKDTRRTAGASKVVSKTPLSELKALEYGRWKDEKFQGEMIPTFAEVCSLVPDRKLMIIELKTGPEIVPFLASEIESANMNHTQLWIISFNSSTIAKSKELLPNIRAHWLTGYRKNKDTGEWSPNASEISATLSACHADGLGTQHNTDVVNERFLSDLKQRGLQEFHVWTVDDADDAKYYRGLGAMGITTNRPGYLRQALDLKPVQAIRETESVGGK